MIETKKKNPCPDQNLLLIIHIGEKTIDIKITKSKKKNA